MMCGSGGLARVHRGPRRRRQEGAVEPWQCTGARARRCSPAAVEEDELDEVVLEGCSLEHEHRRRGDAMEAKNSDGLSSARGSSGERGKRGGQGWGCSSPFIGAKGAPRRGGQGGNGWR
jgi:hypothetical protein